MTTSEGDKNVVDPAAEWTDVGGAMWRVVRGGDDILYSVDYNHKKELHLNGADHPKDMKPTSHHKRYVLPDVVRQAKDKENELKQVVTACLRSGGDVVMPVHSVTRVLEMLMIFESIWKDMCLSYKVAFVTRIPRLLDYAKSLLEWMNESLAKSFDKSRINRFDFKHIVVVENLADAQKLKGPKVCLCSSPNMESGSLARGMFDAIRADQIAPAAYRSRRAPAKCSEGDHVEKSKSLE